MSGLIYFLGYEHHGESMVKVGYTNNLYVRIHNIQTALPEDLWELGEYPGTKEDERELHTLLKPYHVNREWFRLVEPVENLIDDLEDASFLIRAERPDHRPTIRECLDFEGARDIVDALVRHGNQIGYSPPTPPFPVTEE